MYRNGAVGKIKAKKTCFLGGGSTAIGTLKHKTVTIPIFDEVVNPAVTIPAVDGAVGAYVLLQDQQEQYSAIQTVCNPRFDLNMTIRVVTKWGR